MSSWPLFFIALALSLFGALMIYSASAVLGLKEADNPLLYLQKHALFLGVGWLLYFIIAEVNVLKLAKQRHLILFGILILLLSVMIPGLGHTGGGAERWIRLGPMTFQPSELVRLLIVFYMASTLVEKSSRLDSFNKGFLPLLIVVSLVMFLLLLQPDFGAAMGVFLLSASLWFVGGLPLGYFAGLLLFSVPAVLVILFQESYRAERVFAFLDPWSDAQGGGFQLIQSLMGVYEGGWMGLGLGNSEQKLFYLPKAHNDFIFSVVGEELGVFGLALVILLFCALMVVAARIARLQISHLGYLMAMGLAVFFSLPAILNMMVALGLLPTKGMALPFFSSGGSSLVVSMMALGVLQSLHRRRDEELI